MHAATASLHASKPNKRSGISSPGSVTQCSLWDPRRLDLNRHLPAEHAVVAVHTVQGLPKIRLADLAREDLHYVSNFFGDTEAG